MCYNRYIYLFLGIIPNNKKILTLSLPLDTHTQVFLQVNFCLSLSPLLFLNFKEILKF